MAFPMLGPPPHRPRRLEWDAAWIFTRNRTAIDPAEATLLHNIVTTHNKDELLEILRAGHLADEARVSADGIRLLQSKYAFVTRIDGMLFDYSLEFVKK